VRITGSVRIDRIPLSPHGGGPIRVHAPLIAPEPALPVHTANSQHPVYRVLPWRVTLVAFLRRIARPFALEALPFTPALRPTEQCFLLVSHDRPPKTRVGRLYAPRWRFARHLVTFVSLPKLPHIAAPSCAPTRVATDLLAPTCGNRPRFPRTVLENPGASDGLRPAGVCVGQPRTPRVDEEVVRAGRG
jgi:hypothetical protein